MTQFTVYVLARNGATVMDVQSDLLDALATRVVIPLVRRDLAPKTLVSNLTPQIAIDGTAYVVMTQAIAAVPTAELRAPVGQIVEHRDQLVRAMDALRGGV